MRGGTCCALAAVSVMAVGGIIHIHAQGAAGQVRQIAYLKASNGEPGDHLGCGGALDGHAGTGVAISGDGNTIAMAAPHESSNATGVNGDQANNGTYNSGAVYVYTRGGNGAWTQQAYLKASNTGQSDEFGHVVALSADGNTLAVAAHSEASNARGVNGNQADNSIPQSGALYIFTRAGGRWTQQAYLKASNAGEATVGDRFGDGDQFGFSMALSDDGNTVAAGAITEDSGFADNQADNSKASAGAVYVFTRTGTTWAQQAYLKAPLIDGGDLFGYSVALSADGNTLAAGAYDEGGSSRQINGPMDTMRGGSGAAFVFTRANGSWKHQAYLKAANAEQGDSLGVSVAISDDGNTLAVGSLDEDCLLGGINPTPCDADRGGDTSAGATYIFSRNGTAWSQQAYLKASNIGQYDWFGARLAISGDGNTFAVSSINEDSAAQGINGNQKDESAEEAGAVYFFRRNGTTWTQQAYVKGANTQAYDEFGTSVALTRDGRTMVVGAKGEDSAAKLGNQNDNSADEVGAGYVFTY